MSIDREQFERVVVRPTLERLGLPNVEKATACLMAIAAWESRGGRYLVQVQGPALGIYQIEPQTERLIYERLIQSPSPHISIKVRGTVKAFMSGERGEMAWNHAYATAMARCLLYFDPAPLPHVDDVASIYETWRRVWRPGRPCTFAQFRDANEEWR
jgi:hypothetical protein